MSSFNIILILLLVMLTSVAIFVLQADESELTTGPDDGRPSDPVFDEAPEIRETTWPPELESDPIEPQTDSSASSPTEPENA